MTVPNAVEEAKKLDHSYILGVQNCIFTLENSLTLSYKANHCSYLWPSSCALGHLSQRNGNYVHTKPVHECS